MALQERTVIDQMEKTRLGTWQVRQAVEIFDTETNEIKSSTYHRYVKPTGEDMSDEEQAFLDVCG